MPTNFSHFGICVSDLDRSLRFYCDGLGFEAGMKFEIGNDFAHTLEIEGDVSLLSQFVTRDGVSIELIHYLSPGVFGAPSANRNQLGLTHLSLNVDDVDEFAARAVQCGGTRIESTRTRIENPDGSTSDFLFVADPDGTRVELMRLGG